VVNDTQSTAHKYIATKIIGKHAISIAYPGLEQAIFTFSGHVAIPQKVRNRYKQQLAIAN